FYGFLSIILAGLIYRFWEDTPMIVPEPNTILHLIAAVLMGVMAYGSLMKAMRTGEVSAVTPFRYTRLLFGIGLGVVMFGESLSRNMWTGSALIVASGLYIMWRGRRA
ncbi:MAG: DMT family transporter, partial [Pseudomonadota bacterium]